MLAKIYSNFAIRRRRSCLSRSIILLLCFCLFLQIKYHVFDFLNGKVRINTSSTASSNRSLFHPPILNCSGDPLEQWCQTPLTYCNASFIIYNHLFVVTRSVLLQPKLAIGKRTGGEEMQEVLNQPEQDEYFHFEKDFIQLPCDVPKIDGTLPAGHLASIFSSITSYKIPDNVQTIDETTVAIRRQDYANFYHTMTDLYTVYLLCRFFQYDPKSVRILFLDAHPKGNLDLFWSELFHSYTRLGHLKNISAIQYREVIWSQPQPKSEIDLERTRRATPSFFSDFREHILKSFNINYQKNPQIDCQSLNIFFLVRHNYIAHPRNPTGKISRQLSNEKQILEDLKTQFAQHPNINFSTNHFEQLSIVEQLKIIIETDVFVGMHGAGLTHVLFLQSNRALIELAPSPLIQIHFDLLASINKINYHRCPVTDGAPETTQRIYDCITKKVLEMCPLTTVLMINTTITPTLTGNITDRTLNN